MIVDQLHWIIIVTVTGEFKFLKVSNYQSSRNIFVFVGLAVLTKGFKTCTVGLTYDETKFTISEHGKLYWLATETVSYWQAKINCENENSSLVTFKTLDEWITLRNFYNNFYGIV